MRSRHRYLKSPVKKKNQTLLSIIISSSLGLGHPATDLLFFVVSSPTTSAYLLYLSLSLGSL